MNAMSKEKENPKQEIEAGDGSQNYQAGGDINIHNHQPATLSSSAIVRPTNRQIGLFDPKVREIIDVANSNPPQSIRYYHSFLPVAVIPSLVFFGLVIFWLVRLVEWLWQHL